MQTDAADIALSDAEVDADPQTEVEVFRGELEGDPQGYLLNHEEKKKRSVHSKITIYHQY
jgi:hypothetical protein